MTSTTSRAYELAKHPVFLVAAAVATVVQLLIWGLEALDRIPKLSWGHSIVTHGIFICAGLVCFGVLLISRDLQRVRKSFAKVHDINHLYRNALAETSAKLLQLDGSSRAADVNTILSQIEISTIDRVVTIISEQFQLLINRPVVVTFWKIDDEGLSCIEQETSANGVDATRPFRAKKRYSIEHNSIFFDNRDKSGRCCHFYSPDIEVTADLESGYQDERPNYPQFYKSVLVVPIRFCWKTDENSQREEDILGYLQVDTASRNRLNNAEHLYLLSAYADQLYNFLSLVRRNFILS